MNMRGEGESLTFVRSLRDVDCVCTGYNHAYVNLAWPPRLFSQPGRCALSPVFPPAQSPPQRYLLKLNVRVAHFIFKYPWTWFLPFDQSNFFPCHSSVYFVPKLTSINYVLMLYSIAHASCGSFCRLNDPLV